MGKEPNIFKYAAGELSQDAFISWLVSWLDYDEGHELKLAAKKFVALLCRVGGKDKGVHGEDIGGLVDGISLQEGDRDSGRMDVFFRVKIKGSPTCFIVEDKTNTFPHSKQLEKYVKYVKKAYPSTEIVKVYYKTGYIFEKDQAACRKAGYGILDYQAIHDFLSGISTNNYIFDAYRDYIREEKYNAYEKGLSALNTLNGYIHLHEDYVQYELMKSFSISCHSSIGDKVINHGTSSGTPWTQYRFVTASDVYGQGVPEHVFYRIEKRKNKNTKHREFCLSIRQYAKLNRKREAQNTLKRERLKKYIQVFKAIPVNGIRFSDPVRDYTGSNSSEIAVLFFDDKINTLLSVKDKLPEFHKEFVSALEETNLLR